MVKGACCTIQKPEFDSCKPRMGRRDSNELSLTSTLTQQHIATLHTIVNIFILFQSIKRAGDTTQWQSGCLACVRLQVQALVHKTRCFWGELLGLSYLLPATLFQIWTDFKVVYPIEGVIKKKTTFLFHSSTILRLASSDRNTRVLYMFTNQSMSTLGHGRVPELRGGVLQFWITLPRSHWHREVQQQARGQSSWRGSSHTQLQPEETVPQTCCAVSYGP